MLREFLYRGIVLHAALCKAIVAIEVDAHADRATAVIQSDAMG
jgi:hypothetical protein